MVMKEARKEFKAHHIETMIAEYYLIQKKTSEMSRMERDKCEAWIKIFLAQDILEEIDGKLKIKDNEVV